MGVFSKTHRFREAGEDVNVYNEERFGLPYRSLFTSTKFLTLHHEIDITDEDGDAVYHSYSKFFSLRDKTDISRADGSHVAHIERKVLSIREKHFVDMADGTSFELSRELFHLVKDIVNIDGLGWQLRGNILALNFELYDENGDIVALISQKFLSLHDKYCIDIYQPDKEEITVAILVTLQHMIRDREASSAAGSGSSSSSSSN